MLNTDEYCAFLFVNLSAEAVGFRNITLLHYYTHTYYGDDVVCCFLPCTGCPRMISHVKVYFFLHDLNICF